MDMKEGRKSLGKFLKKFIGWETLYSKAPPPPPRPLEHLYVEEMWSDYSQSFMISQRLWAITERV